jgi:8-oxo-dGTP diphosphatase
VDAAWLPVADLEPPRAHLRLAFDHAGILADGIERARAKLEYSALGTAFCTEPFTAAELRRVYEAVWGVPLDPRNFWRKVSSTPGLLVPVPGRSAPGPTGGRPAARFRRGPATTLHPPILRPQPGAC